MNDTNEDLRRKRAAMTPLQKLQHTANAKAKAKATASAPKGQISGAIDADKIYAERKRAGTRAQG